MKKVKYLLSIMLVIFCSTILFACGNPITDIEVTGIETSIAMGHTLVLDEAEVKVTYKDGTTETLEYGDEGLEFVKPSTETAGEKDLLIKYNGFEKVIKLTIYDPATRVNQLRMLESEIVTNFDANRDNMLNSNTEEAKVYYVGDDNAFNFLMKGAGTTPDTNGDGIPEVEDNLVDFDVEFEVSEVEGNTATPLNATQVADYMTINADNTIDFKENAIGRRFNITVTAKYYPNGVLESDVQFTLNNIEVIDAYNVYDATGFSVLENTNATWNGWYSKKTPELRQASIDANGIVLHKNIALADSDLPSNYFYSASEYETMNSAIKQAQNVNVVGSFKDVLNGGWAIAYERLLTADDEGFTFCGNYNQIDYSGLSKVVVEDEPAEATASKVVSVPDTEHPEEGQPITTHATLFRIQSNIADLNKTGLTDAEIQALTQRVVDMNNIAFKGNGKRSSSAYFSGGQLLAKFKGLSTDIERVNFVDTYTGLTFECQDQMTIWDNDKSFHYVKSTHGENCYTMNLYTWGADVMVEDSELLSAGGPATMADYVVSGDNSKEHIPHVDFINTTLESLVTGEEPWFGIYEGATAIFTQMAQNDAAVYNNPNLPSIGKSMMTSKTVNGQTQNNLFNLTCIFKGNENGLTQGRIKGSVTIYESREDYEAQNREEDPVIKTYGLIAEENTTTSAIYDGEPLTNRAISTGGVYFQSNLTGGYFNSGFGTANTDATFVSDGRLHADITAEGKQYTNIYLFNGMCIMFELFPAA